MEVQLTRLALDDALSGNQAPTVSLRVWRLGRVCGSMSVLPNAHWPEARANDVRASGRATASRAARRASSLRERTAKTGSENSDQWGGWRRGHNCRPARQVAGR